MVQSIARHNVFTRMVSLAAFQALLVACSAYSSCPEQVPHMEACLMTWVECDDISELLCDSSNGIDNWNGWYGCEASAEQKQCLTVPVQGSTTCYIECQCYLDDDLDGCEMDSTLCQRALQAGKYEEWCPGEL